MDDTLTDQEDLDKVLRCYYKYGLRRSNSDLPLHSRTIVRSVKKCIVISGPGMGKSALLKKLALDYSGGGFPTLLVRFPQVVTLLACEGCRFEDSLMKVALSVLGPRATLVFLERAVILCDALDECGSQQPLVTVNLHASSITHPNICIVVVSRFIGCYSGELAGWQHYELQPLDDSVVERAVTKVLETTPFVNMVQRSRAVEQATAQLSAKIIKGAVA